MDKYDDDVMYIVEDVLTDICTYVECMMKIDHPTESGAANMIGESSSEYEEGMDENDSSDDLEEIETKEDQVAVKNVIKTTAKKKKTDSPKKKRKQKKAHLRRNIRNVFDDSKLAEKTKKLRDIENERRKRLGIDILTKGAEIRPPVIKPGNVIKKPLPPLKRKPPDVICLDSDSDDNAPTPPPLKRSVPIMSSDVVVLSSDSDEEDIDDLGNEKKAQSDDYYSELGLHTNDSLNTRDAQSRVLINVNHTNKDNDIFVHQAIANELKPHQIGGVRFLYDNLIESISGFRSIEGYGCILAHAMGLGKTIQTITFIDVFLRYTPSKKVLCVVPVNTIQNWMNEFNRWLPPRSGQQSDIKKPSLDTKEEDGDKAVVQALLDDVVDFIEYRMDKLTERGINKQVPTRQEVPVINANDVKTHLDEVNQDDHKPDIGMNDDSKECRDFNVYLIDAQKTPAGRAKIIEEWDKVGGVLLMGYEMYRSIALYSNNKKSKAKMKKGKGYFDDDGEIFPRLKKAICRPGPDLVVCDEGHRIRNYQSGISQALKSIRTRKRLVLTGYPLQNNLIEYWCMVDFVRPNYLGSRQEFANMFERPIMNGQCVDSTDKDKRLMGQRAHVLFSLLEGFVQRRGHNVFQDILPKKEEHVLMIRLSPIQKALYLRLCELTREAYNDSLNPIKTFCLCCKIWNHPDILYNAIRASLEGKQMDIISDEDDITLDESTNRVKRKKKPTSSRSSPLLVTSRSSPLPSISPPTINNSYVSQIGFDPFGTEAREILTDIPQWAGPIFQERPFTPGDIENSGKFFVLKELLDESVACNDKMLVFSQSLLTLNTIEEMLQTLPASSDRCWKKGQDYFRLDGSTGSLEREKLINMFNDEKNNDVKLFLLSTRAGCLGINLVAANRVVVFDVSWNPCHDAQAVCRIYRYGQTKPCFIYRLVSSNTMEKKIYYRQISKQGISDRVVDELSLTENFSKNEIQSLILEDWVDEPTLNFSNASSRYRDTVLSSVLQKCGHWITKVPFKHESLLIEESSQKLNSFEKRAAKRAYEQERMLAQGSQVPYRSYPLQQNFPRNTPVVPVRPFLWRPPSHSTSWPNLQNSMFSVAHNITVPSSVPVRPPSSEEILRLLQQPGYPGSSTYSDTMEQDLDSVRTTGSSIMSALLNSARNALSGPRLTTSNVYLSRHDNNPLVNVSRSNSSNIIVTNHNATSYTGGNNMGERLNQHVTSIVHSQPSMASVTNNASAVVASCASNVVTTCAGTAIKPPAAFEHSYHNQLDPFLCFDDLLSDQDDSASSDDTTDANTHQQQEGNLIVLDDEENS